jgi:hypothetical protein
VEVDMTRPVAQLQEIQPIVGSDLPTLLVVWSASDRNLGDDAIQLLYATSREGPWQPMAPKLKNQGKYRWPVPSGLASQLYVRMVVTDEAGNTTQADAPPVMLDLTQPKVRVLGLENEPRSGGTGIN